MSADRDALRARTVLDRPALTVTRAEVIALLDAADERDRLRAGIEAVRALHPRKDNPTSGCCAPPKLCNGHGPVCSGREHGLNRPDWPCPTIKALSDKELR